MTDYITKLALLLNAVRAPVEAFDKLRDCDEESFNPNQDESFWTELGLTLAMRKYLVKLLSENDWAERELERAYKADASFVPISAENYPKQLRVLPHPPLGLYVKGQIERLLKLEAVAVVGTRKCDSYGKHVAEELGQSLARAGFAVVSGGARGIDAAGHRGCLSAGGVTAAVFGTGIDKVYPVEHHTLFDEIAKTGVLISEYPMGTGGAPWRFPDRNRLIVGLAERVVVVESPIDGGAMITERLAADLGREVWSVPGRITDKICEGTNQLIRDGAQPLTNKNDFIECISGYAGRLVAAGNTAQTAQMNLPLEEPAPAPAVSLSTDEKIVLELLQRQGNRTLDSLLSESGLDMPTLQTCVITLSANGLISETSGRYSAVWQAI